MKSLSSIWSNEESRLHIIYLGAGVVFLAIGLIWSIFICSLIGFVLILCNLISIIITIFKTDFNYGPSGIGIVVFLLFMSLLFNSTRYITKHGHKRHIYEDCPTIVYSPNVKKASKFECFFHFIFDDCKICKDRKERERDILSDEETENLDDEEMDDMYFEFRKN